MSRGLMGVVLDFNQLTYAARTLQRISKAKETKYGVSVTHPGLGRSRIIRGPTEAFVNAAADAQIAEWNEVWRRRLLAAKSQLEREQARSNAAQRSAYVGQRKAEAEQKTAAAMSEIAAVQELLSKVDQFQGAFDWDQLTVRTAFATPKPQAKSFTPPVEPPANVEPQSNSPMYTADALVQKGRMPAPPVEPVLEKVGFIGKLLGDGKRAAKYHEQYHKRWQEDMAAYKAILPQNIAAIFETDHAKWEETRQMAREEFDAATQTIAKESADHARQQRQWEDLRGSWESLCKVQGERVHSCRLRYEAHDPIAVAEYFSISFGTAPRPPWVPQEWRMKYDADARRLVVLMQLPGRDDVPSVCGYTYIPKDDSFSEVKQKKGGQDALFDSVVYQLCLMTLHDIFALDGSRVLHEIDLSGYVRAISAATGTELDTVVLRARCTPEYFNAINLALVEPAACFLGLEGATQAKPHLFKPISLADGDQSLLDDTVSGVRAKTGTLYSCVAFSGESPYARLLAGANPPKWEYQLTAVLVRDRLKKLRLPVVKKPLLLDSAEFLEHVSESVGAVHEAMSQIVEVIHQELTPSWGAPGVAGDAIDMLEAANHLSNQIASVRDIEAQILSEQAMDGRQVVLKAIRGMTDELIVACEQIADALEDACTTQPSESGEPIQITLKLDMPNFVSKVGPAIQAFHDQLLTKSNN